ncbi:hypothetical protein [Aureimonas altamirensis]|uniref:hypothetical protein n=1 Tax=Aureimonas altamirensis TaxID=370622 RepID=UPI00255589EE|nr:hypothetical protein [Aureimonas altamirensis]
MPRITRPLPDGPARKRPPAALRWGVVLLVAAALGAVAGVAVDRLSDPVYSAVARIALEPDAYRPAEGGDDAILMPRLRGKLARIAGDDVLAAASPAPADLRSRVAVHSPQGELTADIVVQAASADAAARDANAIARAFADREARDVEGRRAAERGEAERRVRLAQTALAQAETALAAVQPTAGPEPDRDAPDAEMSRLQRQLDSLRQVADGGPGGADLPESVRTLSERRDAASAELGLLSRTYGPRHPRRVEAARRLAAAEAATRQEATRLVAERQAALDAARSAATQPAAVDPAAPGPVRESAEVARLRAALADASAALDERARGAPTAPVALVIAAEPPAVRDGPSEAAYALMGAAGGILAGLFILAVSGLSRLVGQGAGRTEVVLSDVSYAPVDLARRGDALRLAPPAEPAERRPAHGADGASETEPRPVRERQPEQGSAAPDRSHDPQVDDAVLRRRERLRRELRDMTARRQAELDGGGAARIMSAEELQRRHDERNGPHRL